MISGSSKNGDLVALPVIGMPLFIICCAVWSFFQKRWRDRRRAAIEAVLADAEETRAAEHTAAIEAAVNSLSTRLYVSPKPKSGKAALPSALGCNPAPVPASKVVEEVTALDVASTPATSELSDTLSDSTGRSTGRSERSGIERLLLDGISSLVPTADKTHAPTRSNAVVTAQRRVKSSQL